ncbi:MAG: AAA family ATPase [Chloroflexota bacterium]|nr:AAA family ATPase [Chloroflexota bacterium]
MRLQKARVRKYRSVRDSGWFDVESKKTLFVGPNEAGKTVLLKALEQINPPDDVPKFEPLRDFPRSEFSDLQRGSIVPGKVTVVEAHFKLEDEDEEAITQIDESYAASTYVFGRRLDNSFWHRIDGGPQIPTYKDIRNDLLRLASHVHGKSAASDVWDSEATPRQELDEMVAEWDDASIISGEMATSLEGWLDRVFPLVDEENTAEENRLERLTEATKVSEKRREAVKLLHERLPVFVNFSNYFRVRPRLHLRQLAERLEQNLLDDDQYDRGNECLLKFLGFTARELSNLGDAPDPGTGNQEALKFYQDQLDERRYQLNAASVQLTDSINAVWRPDPERHEADRLRIEADQQYLKVVVEDELGVEVELDQRSEGFQWLVSFFVVFFAEARERYDNAVLLLDEPGLSLHGLKQREFRTTVSRLGETNQLLFTTHSPFLVGPDELDLVRVVEMKDRKTGTEVHTTITAGDSAALLPLQEALGYDLAQSLFTHKRNLILEGLTDYWYIEATAALLGEAGYTKLNDRIALIPADAASKVVYFATILHANNLKVAALLDSDSAGDAAATVDTLVHTLGNRNILRTVDSYTGDVKRPEIEDLLRDTLVHVAKSELGWNIEKTATQQPSRSIIDIFTKEIGRKIFSKYRLAKAFLRWTRERRAEDLTDIERTQWEDLIKTINKALR